MIDVVTKYAEDILAERIVAGEYVQAQCLRHMRDLDRSDIYFDRDAAAEGLQWFPDHLRLGVEAFIPFDWQAFWLGSIHGWKRMDGLRRFRRSYKETGKGSGKTPIAAGLGCQLCFAEGEYRAEGYVVARTMEQALVAYRDAAAFIAESPSLQDPNVRIMGIASPYNLVQADTGSFLKRLAANDQGAGRSGYRPHFALCDEYHEHSSSAMVDMMDAGFKARKQPILIITTNAGAGKGSACGQEHDYAVAVATGEREDDTYLPYVCTLDDGDDLQDEDIWLKTNPSLDPPIDPETGEHYRDSNGKPVLISLPGKDYIHLQLSRSEGLPAKRALVERLLFCKWSDAIDPWVDPSLLDELWIDEEDVDRTGECVGGIDLSSRRDLTAGALVWRQPDGTMDVDVTAWTPADTLPAREVSDAAPYRQWVEQGYMIAVPGAVMDFAYVAQWVNHAYDDAAAGDFAYDPWRIDELIRELERAGVDSTKAGGMFSNPSLIKLHPHPQGFNTNAKTGLGMPVAIDAAERAILTRRIRLVRNPALRSAILGAAVIKDASGNRRFNKTKSTTRIDMLIAMVIAIGLSEVLDGTMTSDPTNFNPLEGIGA